MREGEVMRAAMGEQGPVIKVHSGPNLLFSCTKLMAGANEVIKSADLAPSLREAQVQVNKFLTELVERSGTQEENKGQGEELDDEEDDEEDDEDDTEDKVSEAVVCPKRKVDDGSSSNSDKIPGKRVKSL